MRRPTLHSALGRGVAGGLFAAVAPTPASAQDPAGQHGHPPTPQQNAAVPPNLNGPARTLYRIPALRVDRAPMIDGVLDDDVW